MTQPTLDPVTRAAIVRRCITNTPHPAVTDSRYIRERDNKPHDPTTPTGYAEWVTELAQQPVEQHYHWLITRPDGQQITGYYSESFVRSHYGRMGWEYELKGDGNGQ